MDPDLDELIKKEAEAFENLSQAFIQHSLARNAVKNRLREIGENQPTLFTAEPSRRFDGIVLDSLY